MAWHVTFAETLDPSIAHEKSSLAGNPFVVL
jgi:hypothetical protein